MKWMLVVKDAALSACFRTELPEKDTWAVNNISRPSCPNADNDPGLDDGGH